MVTCSLSIPANASVIIVNSRLMTPRVPLSQQPAVAFRLPSNTVDQIWEAEYPGRLRRLGLIRRNIDPASQFDFITQEDEQSIRREKIRKRRLSTIPWTTVWSKQQHFQCQHPVRAVQHYIVGWRVTGFPIPVDRPWFDLRSQVSRHVVCVVPLCRPPCCAILTGLQSHLQYIYTFVPSYTCVGSAHCHWK